jgi:uncharacterized membrane protein
VEGNSHAPPLYLRSLGFGAPGYAMSDDSGEDAARIAALEAELARLRATVDVLEQWGLRYGLKFPGTVSASPPPAASATSVPSTVAPSAAAAGAVSAQPGSAASAAAAPAKKPPGTEQVLIFVMYGVGLFVLLIGAAIILPATLGLIGPAARAIIGVLVGFGLLAFGGRGSRRTWIADGLVALGASLEYLSLWSAHHEKLVPTAPLFALMVATTAFVGALAYVHRSERLAFAGLAGGAIVPLLVADSQAHPLGLCVYLAVLTAFGLALAIARGFRYLEFAVFGLLMLYSPAWAFGSALSDDWTSLDALGATAVFFFELAGAVVYGARRGRLDLARHVLFALEIGAFAGMLDQRPPSELVPYLIGRAVFVVILLAAAQLRAVPGTLREIAAWWGLGGVALLAQSLLAPSTGGSLGVEGAVLAALGARRNDDGVRVGSAIAFAACGIIATTLMAADFLVFWPTYETPFVNANFATLALFAAALGAALFAERTSRAPKRNWLNLLTIALHATAVTALARQAYDLCAHTAFEGLAVTVTMTLYAAALIAFGIRGKSGLLRVTGVVLFFITVVKVFSVDLAGVDVVVRFFSFLGLGLALVVMALIYQRAVARTAHAEGDAP